MRFLLALIFISLTGCSLIGHLDQALMLNDYGNNKAYQKKIIKVNDDHYDALVKSVADGTIKQYKTKADIRRAFGEPIQIKSQADKIDCWLYRYAIFHQAKTKIYLYFNGDQLINFEQLSNELMGGDS